MPLSVTVTCDLPGLTEVTATYNLLATARQLEAWRQNLDATTAAPVVTVQGYAGDPFGPDAPLALRFWLAFTGWQKALVQFLTDPNSWTA
ncbi:MAG: hypothetical protein N2383_03360 [Caldilineales bacterium]|nr:hypothetical protein [Caldilineales bacterium]